MRNKLSILILLIFYVKNIYINKNIFNDDSNSCFLRLRTRSIFDMFAGAQGDSTNFRSGWGNVISNSISLTFPSSCVGQLINIGYLANEYDEDDYPYNPNCGAQSQSNNLCFPGNSMIISKDRGEIEIKDLRQGELILTRDLNTMKLKYSKVELMLHKDDNLYKEDEWISIEYIGMKNPLILSPFHLVFTKFLGENPYQGNCYHNNLFLEIIGIRKDLVYTKNTELNSVLAKDIKIGDSIIIDSSQTISWVSKIELIKSENNNYIGRYAPLTSDGCLIVNGVLVSSYSKPFPWPLELIQPTHELLDFLVKPFIYIELYFNNSFNWARNNLIKVLNILSRISSYYKYDHSTLLSLEVIRAITLLLK